MKRHLTRTISPVFLLFIALSLDGCLLSFRTSTVYGTVTEQGRKPLEGVKISVLGIKANRSTLLHELSTNQAGEFQLTFEVPRGYSRLDIGIPSIENHQSQEIPRLISLYINGEETKDCCSTLIGKKTKYDFVFLVKE
ncbi:hypothetical protein GCM10027275_06120 [Rhabdobacter roseus]|uniref:Carboxypeptidase regulatory-like domain-containing protein n=1 Tax=Rhabdobacter roseus TaxID=1655419 RepID=A0A840TEF0_9BACT|nr:hypothetical protein [Rhabdobacter roseus]MBB5282506.1 hypothetical protein [Rhabdobacter roseus]